MRFAAKPMRQYVIVDVLHVTALVFLARWQTERPLFTAAFVCLSAVFLLNVKDI